MTRPLTRKGAETRGRIVAGAAAEARERGVDDVRLEDVMARTGTSKGQLFHYFPGGKDELLLAVARHEADRVLDDQQPLLGDLTSWPAWLQWRDRLVARYLAQGLTCPLGGLLGEASRRSPAAREVVNDLMHRWQDALAAGVRQMQATGDMRTDVDPALAAAALLAGVQGGVVLLLSTGGVEHLEAALDVGLAGLRPVDPADAPGHVRRLLHGLAQREPQAFEGCGEVVRREVAEAEAEDPVVGAEP